MTVRSNPKPPAFPTPEARAELLALQRAGNLSLRQLEADLGVGKSTIGTALAKAREEEREAKRAARAVERTEAVVASAPDAMCALTVGRPTIRQSDFAGRKLRH